MRERGSCTRYKTLGGGFVHRGVRGPNELKFNGRLGGRKLKRGSYRLRAVAVDTAKKESQARRSAFSIVRR